MPAERLPLAPCPAGIRSCVYEQRVVRQAPADLLEAAEVALREVRSLRFGYAESVERVAPERAHAVFRVLLFRDDVEVAVTPHEYGAVLHVRSASRTGRGDLGVNRRRVNALLTRLGLEP
jgi:uncharacterized protein (DUF1499 family)